MILKRQENGIIILGIVFLIIFVIVIGRYFVLASDTEHADTAYKRMEMTVEVAEAEGLIYDRNMKSLVGNNFEYQAVIIPQLVNREEIALFAEDKYEFKRLYDKGEPYVIKCRSYTKESEGITVFRTPVRYSEKQLAQHVIGYTSQGIGVDGIEYAYDRILREHKDTSSVTYIVDGFGRVMAGEEKKVIYNASSSTGVVLTIDSEIQKICESAGRRIEKGAIAVADIKSGDILAIASFPTYSVYDLEKALNDKNSPMINRVLYSYNVGSVFKLMTAAEGINEGYENYVSNCNGSVNIMGQNFNCHKLEGHGHQNITNATVNSCNTYFINLSNNFNIESFRNMCFKFGFGREIHLCAGISSSAGILPSVDELLIPAELANFSFGQGKLTATPLQILQATCSIANNGEMPMLRLIKGMTENGIEILNEKPSQYAMTVDEKTSDMLMKMMIAAIEDNENTKAKPLYTTAGAKTSTAQTGKFDENNNEILNAWITGFFPGENPEYAVTVLVEDGGYGNDSAAPVFREIADKIVKSKENY